MGVLPLSGARVVMVEDASGEEIELDDECSAAATFLELSVSRKPGGLRGRM